MSSIFSWQSVLSVGWSSRIRTCGQGIKAPCLTTWPYSNNFCTGGGIRTHSDKALVLETSPTLLRWRTHMKLGLAGPRYGEPIICQAMPNAAPTTISCQPDPPSTVGLILRPYAYGTRNPVLSRELVRQPSRLVSLAGNVRLPDWQLIVV